MAMVAAFFSGSRPPVCVCVWVSECEWVCARVCEEWMRVHVCRVCVCVCTYWVRQIQGSLAIIAHMVNIGTLVDQQLHNVFVPIDRSE
jgi:hypothetical protein